jgi:hypothetical protein
MFSHGTYATRVDESVTGEPVDDIYIVMRDDIRKTHKWSLQLFVRGFAGQVDELNIEDQCRVGRNHGPESALSCISDVNTKSKDKVIVRIQTVSHMRRDGKRALFADAHPDEAFIPTFDDLTNADWRGLKRRVKGTSKNAQ